MSLKGLHFFGLIKIWPVMFTFCCGGVSGGGVSVSGVSGGGGGGGGV